MHGEDTADSSFSSTSSLAHEHAPRAAPRRYNPLAGESLIQEEKSVGLVDGSTQYGEAPASPPSVEGKSGADARGGGDEQSPDGQEVMGTAGEYRGGSGARGVGDSSETAMASTIHLGATYQSSGTAGSASDLPRTPDATENTQNTSVREEAGGEGGGGRLHGLGGVEPYHGVGGGLLDAPSPPLLSLPHAIDNCLMLRWAPIASATYYELRGKHKVRFLGIFIGIEVSWDFHWYFRILSPPILVKETVNPDAGRACWLSA